MSISFKPLGLYAHLACVWEVTARKPGNVHRFCDFADVGYLDFIASAAAIGPAFEQAENTSVGQLVLEAITRTRDVVSTNTNLGITLLLAPLAVSYKAEPLREGVEGLLLRLTVDDAKYAYQAIRLAAPGGLGQVQQHDVSSDPTVTLGEVMQLAADRDMIARQYANGFREVFDEGVTALNRGLEELQALENAIIVCHLHLLSNFPDSLIARKCGKALAEEASRRAEAVLAAGWPHSAAGQTAITEFDTWLRADGHRRNPGTTADLVTASLFVALREGIITLPPQVPWSVR